MCQRSGSRIVSSILTRIDIPEIETESTLHSGVKVSKTNCKIMESFNIYENTQLKKAKYAIKYFLKILNTQLKFEIPK